MAKSKERKSTLSDNGFVLLMQRFSKQARTEIRVENKRGMDKRVIFTSYDGASSFEEEMIGTHEAGWASWCAFRLLHPAVLCDFEKELRDLFDEYKRGERKWGTYNDEKRLLLRRYLEMPYAPKKRGSR